MGSFKRKYFSDKIHIIISILRILFGILFIFSASTKLVDISSFESSIKKFAIIPDYFAGIASYVIPIAELILGFCIILKIKIELTVQLMIYLLLFFTSVLTVALVEGSDISCGCFGALSENALDFTTIIRNLILISWGLLIYYRTIQLKHSSEVNLKIKRYFKSFFIISILFFLMVQNSAFAIRNIELKKRVYWLINNDLLAEGEILKPLKVFDMKEIEKEIIFTNFDFTILFIMQYGCHLCKENAFYWNELTNKLSNNKHIQIYGVSIDAMDITNKIAIEYSPKFTLVFNSSEDFRNDLKLFRTPQTLIIGKKGSVLKIIKGKLNNILVERVAQEVIINK